MYQLEICFARIILRNTIRVLVVRTPVTSPVPAARAAKYLVRPGAVHASTQQTR